MASVRRNGAGDFVVLWVYEYATLCIYSLNTKHKLLQSGWQSHLSSGTWNIHPAPLLLLGFPIAFANGDVWKGILHGSHDNYNPTSVPEKGSKCRVGEGSTHFL